MFKKINLNFDSLFYMIKEIKTPWGKIIPEVSLFPIYYLLFIYCFIYILPYGKFFVGISWFDWLRSEDGPLGGCSFSNMPFHLY